METLTLTILTLDLAENRRSDRRRRCMSPRWSRRSWRGWALRTIWEWRRSVQRWRRWRFWEEASHWTQSFLLFSPFLPFFFFLGAFLFAFDDDIYLFFSRRHWSYNAKIWSHGFSCSCSIGKRRKKKKRF